MRITDYDATLTVGDVTMDGVAGMIANTNIDPITGAILPQSQYVFYPNGKHPVLPADAEGIMTWAVNDHHPEIVVVHQCDPCRIILTIIS